MHETAFLSNIDYSFYLLNLGFFKTRRLILNPRQFIGSELESKSFPNQGIRESAKNALTMGIIGGLLGGILVGVFEFILNPTSKELFVAIRGVYYGVACTLIFGGFSCIQHFLLRCRLVYEDSIPWNYARFLDYATNSIFLQKVGGGYIFIHRMLMEHLAQMPHNSTGEDSYKVTNSFYGNDSVKKT